MISMRIAIIGIDQKQNLQLAQQVHQLMGYPIVKDTNDEMKYLLNLDVKKYFSAYQMHILLNRCREWSKPGDKIFCDALFTSYHSMVAALESGVINESEFLVYKDKQNEYIDTLKECDFVFHLTKRIPTVDEVDAELKQLPLNYYQLCYDFYMKKVNELKLQMGECFMDIDIEQVNSSFLQRIFYKENQEKDGIKELVKESVSEDDSSDEVDPIESLTLEIHHINSNIMVLKECEEIKTLIESFQEGLDISSCVPCVALQAQDYMCLKLIQEDGDESIRCKILSTIDEVKEFFT